MFIRTHVLILSRLPSKIAFSLFIFLFIQILFLALFFKIIIHVALLFVLCEYCLFYLVVRFLCSAGKGIRVLAVPSVVLTQPTQFGTLCCWEVSEGSCPRKCTSWSGLKTASDTIRSMKYTLGRNKVELCCRLQYGLEGGIGLYIYKDMS